MDSESHQCVNVVQCNIINTCILQETTSQSDSQRMYVRQMYGSGRLWEVVADYSASGVMNVSLTRGTLVGVIKEGDPMGNKDRWFVDNGGQFMTGSTAPYSAPRTRDAKAKF